MSGLYCSVDRDCYRGIWGLTVALTVMLTHCSYSDAAVFHDTVASGLTAATTYFYIVGDDAAGYSAEFSFTTAPPAFRPFSVAVYGDMGISNSEATTGVAIRVCACVGVAVCVRVCVRV